jgi:hypothetical protein
MPKLAAQDSIKSVEGYFSSLSEKYGTGQAREHAYRPVFETLIHSLDTPSSTIDTHIRLFEGKSL